MIRSTARLLILSLVAASPLAASSDLQPDVRSHLAQLHSGKAEVRQAACDALRNAGDEARQALLDALLDLRQAYAARCRSFSVSGETQAHLLELHQAEGQQAAEYWRLVRPVLRRFRPVAAAYQRLEEVDDQIVLTKATGETRRTPPLHELLGSPVKPAVLDLLRQALDRKAPLPLPEPSAEERPAGETQEAEEAEEAKEDAPSQAETLAALREKLAPHAQALTSPNRTRRVAAHEAFRIEGEHGRALLRERLLAMREPLIERCNRLQFAEPAQEKLLKIHAALSEARQAARDAIFKGEFDGKKVDDAVARVKTLYGIYRETFVPALRPLQPVLEAYERLLEVDEQLALTGGTGALELKPTLDELASGVRPELLEALRKAYAFRDHGARCLRYNRAVETSARSGERELVKLTNEHRLMLGIRPMVINERLVQAARKHSREMNRLGYFSHGSPVKANANFGARCKKEGYTGGPTGENIYSGGGGPSGAFRGWYYSAGHHRNMANPGNNEIGIGRDGGKWTENFGRRNDIDLDRPPRKW
jgi:uncharacterized protein YkwD